MSQVGGTALIEASFRGHADSVRLLVEVAADKEAKDNVRDAHTSNFLESVWYVYSLLEKEVNLGVEF